MLLSGLLRNANHANKTRLRQAAKVSSVGVAELAGKYARERVPEGWRLSLGKAHKRQICRPVCERKWHRTEV